MGDEIGHTNKGNKRMMRWKETEEEKGERDMTHRNNNEGFKFGKSTLKKPTKQTSSIRRGRQRE